MRRGDDHQRTSPGAVPAFRVREVVVAVRVLLTGASGLVGTWMRRTVPDAVDLVCVRHRSPVAWPRVADLDVRDPRSVVEVVGAVAPDVVVHLAYAVDERSIVHGTRALAATGAPLILASTDAVFSGDGRVRAELEQPDPVWDYGRWKVAAEEIVVEGPDSAVVRLPLMASLDPADTTTTAIRAAHVERRPLGWYRGETRMPAWSEDVARGLWSLTNVADRSGVWHLSGPSPMTRAQLGAAIAAHLGVPDSGEVVDPPPLDERPHDLRLSDQRARAELGWSPRPIASAMSGVAGDDRG